MIEVMALKKCDGKFMATEMAFKKYGERPAMDARLSQT
jgi:hypothetical protein